VPQRCHAEDAVLRIRVAADDAGQWRDLARLLPHPERIETMSLLPDHPPVTSVTVPAFCLHCRSHVDDGQ
jgi:protein ImuB